MFIPPITTGNFSPLFLTAETDDIGNTGETGGIAGVPTFLDVFKNIVEDAKKADAQKSQDMIDIMLGNNDNIEEIQSNLAKAEIATELLVNVKNSVLTAYNEIMRMNI